MTSRLLASSAHRKTCARDERDLNWRSLTWSGCGCLIVYSPQTSSYGHAHSGRTEIQRGNFFFGGMRTPIFGCVNGNQVRIIILNTARLLQEFERIFGHLRSVLDRRGRDRHQLFHILALQFLQTTFSCSSTRHEVKRTNAVD